MTPFEQEMRLTLLFGGWTILIAFGVCGAFWFWGEFRRFRK